MSSAALTSADWTAVSEVVRCLNVCVNTIVHVVLITVTGAGMAGQLTGEVAVCSVTG